MEVLLKRKVCFPLLGLSVKAIQAKETQGIYKGFKFHYKSIAFFGVLFGAESQWNIFLKVSGSPCQLCLCRVRIVLYSLLDMTIPCFPQIRLNQCLISVTALTFWNASLWWTVYETAPNYRGGIFVYQYPCAFLWRLDIYIASLCQSPWQLSTRRQGYVFKYSYFQFFSN